MDNKYLFVKKDLDKKFLKMYTATYETNGKKRDYFFVSRNEEEDLAVMNDEIKPTAIEAFTYIKDNGVYKIVMIDELRSAFNKRFSSFCAGLIEKGEDYKEAVKREVYEELGGTVKSVELLQNYPMALCAGMTDEANIYTIVELESLGKQHLEETEDIKVKIYDVKDLENKIQNNELLLTVSGYLGAMLLINRLK